MIDLLSPVAALQKTLSAIAQAWHVLCSLLALATLASLAAYSVGHPYRPPLWVIGKVADWLVGGRTWVDAIDDWVSTRAGELGAGATIAVALFLLLCGSAFAAEGLRGTAAVNTTTPKGTAPTPAHDLNSRLRKQYASATPHMATFLWVGLATIAQVGVPADPPEAWSTFLVLVIVGKFVGVPLSLGRSLADGDICVDGYRLREREIVVIVRNVAIGQVWAAVVSLVVAALVFPALLFRFAFRRSTDQPTWAQQTADSILDFLEYRRSQRANEAVRRLESAVVASARLVRRSVKRLLMVRWIAATAWYAWCLFELCFLETNLAVKQTSQVAEAA